MKYIEEGWRNYRRLCVPRTATPEQVQEFRQAYFAGASILHLTVQKALSPGPGETAGDLHLMQAIQTELDAFGQALDRKIIGGDPSAMRAMAETAVAQEFSGRIDCPKCGHQATVNVTDRRLQ